MHIRVVLSCLLTFLLFWEASGQDWPQWRGPAGVNHASAGATAPIEWSEQKGLSWVTELPRRGNSSPTSAIRST